MLFSCAKNNPEDQLPEVVKNMTGHEKWETKADYSNTGNWLSLPSSTSKAVDVVYFYPTCYSPAEGDPDLCDIDHQGMRDGAKNCLASQASVFSEDCNVFAPYYRQVSGMYGLSVSNEDNATLFRYAAAQDASAALDYYFEHYNNGRPFILAGHSQGSETSLFLLADYFRKHSDEYRRMVAAYIIAYSVTSDFLKENTHVKYASGASDTGVVISWNTEGPGNSGQHNVVLLPNAVSINPINWKLDDTKAELSENLGSFDKNSLTVTSGIADARIDLTRGSVICTTVDPSKYAIAMTALFGPECYHGYDYEFYYVNLRENVKQRISSYLLLNL